LESELTSSPRSPTNNADICGWCLEIVWQCDKSS
jgi:hypothetical protein